MQHGKSFILHLPFIQTIYTSKTTQSAPNLQRVPRQFIFKLPTTLKYRFVQSYVSPSPRHPMLQYSFTKPPGCPRLHYSQHENSQQCDIFARPPDSKQAALLLLITTWRVCRMGKFQWTPNPPTFLQCRRVPETAVFVACENGRIKRQIHKATRLQTGWPQLLCFYSVSNRNMRRSDPGIFIRFYDGFISISS